VIETYRMLGEQRQADFDREAQRFRQAALLPRHRRRLHVPLIGRLRSRPPRVAVTGAAAALTQKES
jgi:hypothetical protein